MLLYPRKTAILELTRPSNQGYLTMVYVQNPQIENPRKSADS